MRISDVVPYKILKLHDERPLAEVRSLGGLFPQGNS